MTGVEKEERKTPSSEMALQLPLLHRELGRHGTNDSAGGALGSGLVYLDFEEKPCLV